MKMLSSSDEIEEKLNLKRFILFVSYGTVEDAKALGLEMLEKVMELQQILQLNLVDFKYTVSQGGTGYNGKI